jgi:hypothetical protein
MAKDAIKAAVQDFESAVKTRLDNEAHIIDEPAKFYLDDNNYRGIGYWSSAYG